MRGGDASEENQIEVARHFNVSELTIRTLLVNHASHAAGQSRAGRRGRVEHGHECSRGAGRRYAFERKDIRI